MFKCLYLISFNHGFLRTYSSRIIFWYKQFYVFSITPKTSTIPLDDVVVSHDLVGRIFIFLWFTLVDWLWWHRGFCTIRESYRRPISPRRSLSFWSWRVRAESGDLWWTSPSCPLWHESAILSTGLGTRGSSLGWKRTGRFLSELTSWIALFGVIIFMSISLSSFWAADLSCWAFDGIADAKFNFLDSFVC